MQLVLGAINDDDIAWALSFIEDIEYLYIAFKVRSLSPAVQYGILYNKKCPIRLAIKIGILAMKSNSMGAGRFRVVKKISIYVPYITTAHCSVHM